MNPLGAGSCSLDVTSVSSIRAFDFEEELELSEDAAEKMEDVLVALAELRKLVDAVDRDLGDACASMLRDLGAPAAPPGASLAPRACGAAAERLRAAIAEITETKTTVSLDVAPPRCTVDMRAAAECAASCDDAFDPKAQKPVCKGGAASDGACAGEVELPDLAMQCDARCGVETNAHASCAPPRIVAQLSGPADGAAKERLRLVLEKDLPRVLTVAMALGQRALQVAGNARGIAEDVKGAVEGALKKTANPRAAAVRGAKLASCLGPAFQGGADSVMKIKGDVAAAARVRDALEPYLRR